MTLNELLKMIDEAQECRIGLQGKSRYVSLPVSKFLLRKRADDLITAGVSVEFCDYDHGKTLYVESGL